MNAVADTHALLWWFTESPQLGRKAAEIFQSCEQGGTVIFIPAIVIAEALSIFEKKRVTFLTLTGGLLLRQAIIQAGVFLPRFVL